MTADVVLVGGSGTIGRALAATLVADGVGVVVVSRNPVRARRHGTAGVVEPWSVDRVDELAGRLAGVRAVVNLAGVPVGPWPWWIPGRRRAIVRSRIDTTRAIVEALRRLEPGDRPSVLVSVSGTDG
jgi:NAD dependent epimerase/dehydratase family enzyme